MYGACYPVRQRNIGKNGRNGEHKPSVSLRGKT